MRNLKVIISLFVFVIFMIGSTELSAQSKPAQRATKAKKTEMSAKGATKAAPVAKRKPVKSSREKIKANRARFMKARKSSKKTASN